MQPQVTLLSIASFKPPSAQITADESSIPSTLLAGRARPALACSVGHQKTAFLADIRAFPEKDQREFA
jgi:hypothetical protein